jgi:hypothetical protein
MGGLVVSLVSMLVLNCAQKQEVAKFERTDESVLTNRLWKLWEALHDANVEADRYPINLRHLRTNSFDPLWFICPGTGSQPGALERVDEWGDFIYVGGVWDGVPLTALLISPPENHSEKCGYVVLVAGSIRRLSPKETREVIKQPWLLSTDATPDNIAYLKEELSVNVPMHLQRFYPESPLSPQDLCLSNLTSIWEACQQWMGDGAIYPSNLSVLVQPIITNSAVFVCSATGHKPGSMTNVDQWTDYIYFASAPELYDQIPVVICPPENHGGRFGHVIWQGRNSDRLTPAQIAELIREPWSMQAPLSSLALARYQESIVVHIPERLRNIYTNAYAPRKSSAAGQ